MSYWFVKDAALPAVLLKLIQRDAELRPAALRGLAAYADPKTPDAVLAIYPSLPAPEKRDALLTLSSRAAFAHPLLAAMADGRVPAKDVPADIARQIRGLNDATITQELEKVWGSARESSAEKLQAQARYKAVVSARDTSADAGRGRAVFTRTCA
ncbi:MAG: dehydrogenase, partial [Verrucomicrobiota bacterium]